MPPTRSPERLLAIVDAATEVFAQTRVLRDADGRCRPGRGRFRRHALQLRRGERGAAPALRGAAVRRHQRGACTSVTHSRPGRVAGAPRGDARRTRARRRARACARCSGRCRTRAAQLAEIVGELFDLLAATRVGADAMERSAVTLPIWRSSSISACGFGCSISSSTTSGRSTRSRRLLRRLRPISWRDSRWKRSRGGRVIDIAIRHLRKSTMPVPVRSRSSWWSARSCVPRSDAQAGSGGRCNCRHRGRRLRIHGHGVAANRDVDDRRDPSLGESSQACARRTRQPVPRVVPGSGRRDRRSHRRRDELLRRLRSVRPRGCPQPRQPVPRRQRDEAARRDGRVAAHCAPRSFPRRPCRQVRAGVAARRSDHGGDAARSSQWHGRLRQRLQHATAHARVVRPDSGVFLRRGPRPGARGPTGRTTGCGVPLFERELHRARRNPATCDAPDLGRVAARASDRAARALTNLLRSR